MKFWHAFDLTLLKFSYKLLYSLIFCSRQSHGKLKIKRVAVDAEIPVNTTATIFLPTNNPEV
jgi:hypothetical protein